MPPRRSYAIRPFAASGFGVTLRYDFNRDAGQEITMCRISPACKTLFVAKGEIVGGVGFGDYSCSEGVFFRVKDGNDFFQKQLEVGNHVPLVYGDYFDQVVALGKHLGCRSLPPEHGGPEAIFQRRTAAWDARRWVQPLTGWSVPPGKHLPLVRNYVRDKFLLSHEDGAAEELMALADLSLRKILRLKKEGKLLGDISRGCGGQSLLITKKVLLMKAVQEDFKILTPAQSAAIQTLEQRPGPFWPKGRN